MSNTLSLRASKLFDLTSKVACVTGGGTGIGLMAAQALAAQGARVYIAGRRMELLEQAVKVHGSKEALGDSGGSLIPLQADITSKESIKNLVKTIEEKDKILHILVNNSGISGETVKTAAGDESAEKLAKELDEDTFDGWNEVYKTNVAGHYFTSAACLPLLSKATKESGGEKWGNIINITSISGITSNAQNHFSYNATKAAAIHLTNMMATEFSRDGVKRTKVTKTIRARSKRALRTVKTRECPLADQERMKIWLKRSSSSLATSTFRVRLFLSMADSCFTTLRRSRFQKLHEIVSVAFEWHVVEVWRIFVASQCRQRIEGCHYSATFVAFLHREDENSDVCHTKLQRGAHLPANWRDAFGQFLPFLQLTVKTITRRATTFRISTVTTLLTQLRPSLRILRTPFRAMSTSQTPPLKKTRLNPLLGTHSGTFHCDESLAIFLLRLLPEYSKADLVRSRDPKVLEECDVVVDVGGVYDDEKKRYDHHQRGFMEVFEFKGEAWKTKLSSAGLVYKHYGLAIISQVLNVPQSDPIIQTLYPKIYTDFVEALDGIDNGVSLFPTSLTAGTSPAYRSRTDLSSRVGNLNPRWNQPSSDSILDEKFEEASKLTGKEFLERVDYLAKSWLPAREIVLNGISERKKFEKSGRVIVFEEFSPWKEHLHILESELAIPADELPLYVLYPEGTDPATKWRIQAVPKDAELFESRKALPEQWRGVRDDELSKLSGIDGCIFVHAAGFIGGNKTKEGALEMATKALDM